MPNNDVQQAPISNPDELLVMPVEEYLKLLAEQLRGVQFIGMNASRSFEFHLGSEEPKEGAAPNIVGICAVGFDLPDHQTALSLMSSITNCDDIVLTTDHDEIEAILDKFIDEDTDGSKIVAVTNEPPTPHPEAGLDDDDGVVRF